MKELSLHILDLVQNCVSAGASLIEIIIEESLINDFMKITIKDDGCGMDKDLIEKIRNPFFTTRTTRRVGLGIPLMEAACERCQGNLTIESEKGIGTIVTASFKHSHIDRAPLGNMVDTFITIILGKTEIDYIYKHKIDDKEFTIDTRQLKTILGEEVSISNSDVLAWINEYINDGLRNLMEV